MGKKTEVETFAFQIKAVGLPTPECEYRFHPTRKWKFDFAFLDLMIAAEIEGGVWVQGRHVRGSGFIADCHKYNEAGILGWLVLRFPTGMVDSGEAIEQLERAVDARKKES